MIRSSRAGSRDFDSFALLHFEDIGSVSFFQEYFQPPIAVQERMRLAGCTFAVAGDEPMNNVISHADQDGGSFGDGSHLMKMDRREI